MAAKLKITRTFNASRQRVFRAWKDPKMFTRWWGPNGFTVPFCKIDFKKGGVVHYAMRSPEGRDFWSKGTYLDIVEPELIAVSDSFSDEKGNIVPATQYGMSPDTQLEMLLTVTFTERDGKTEITLKHVGLSDEDRKLAGEGWNQSLDRLTKLLAVKAIPEGYHTVTCNLIVKNVEQAIDFYKRALEAQETYSFKNPDDHSMMHAEIRIGDSPLMLGTEMAGEQVKSAQTLGGSPVALYVYVEDSDGLYTKAIAAGGKEKQPLADMFWGDRCGTFIDPFGLQWTIATHVEDLTSEEIEQRGREFFERQKAA